MEMFQFSSSSGNMEEKSCWIFLKLWLKRENALRNLLVTDTLEREQEDESDIESQEEAEAAVDISNIYKLDAYDSSGCPTVPMAFSGMMVRLGNVMCAPTQAL